MAEDVVELGARKGRGELREKWEERRVKLRGSFRSQLHGWC